jgi:hypothetical protein
VSAPCFCCATPFSGRNQQFPDGFIFSLVSLIADARAHALLWRLFQCEKIQMSGDRPTTSSALFREKAALTMFEPWVLARVMVAITSLFSGGTQLGSLA